MSRREHSRGDVSIRRMCQAHQETARTIARGERQDLRNIADNPRGAFWHTRSDAFKRLSNNRVTGK
jgi:hypothetical protein